LRVLIAGTTYHPALNGQAVFMVNLAEGLVGRSHEVAVLFPDAHSYSGLRNGVQMEAVGSVSLGFIHGESYAPFIFTEVRRVFESFQPDVVHIQDHYPLSVAVVRQARRHPPHRHQSLQPGEPGAIPGSAWIRASIASCGMDVASLPPDCVTAPSPAAVNLLRALGLRVPLHAVSCGTDLDRFRLDPSVDRTACRLQYGLDPRRKIFLYVGRVDQEKRIDVLLRAVHELRRDDVQLAIAGQGADSVLQRRAQELQLGDRVPSRSAATKRTACPIVDVFTMAGEAES
jgi:glycosyltransferase involved in cell wall biosynthesis